MIWYQMTPPRVSPWRPTAGPVGASYPQSLSDILREAPTEGVDEEVAEVGANSHNRYEAGGGGGGGGGGLRGACKMKEEAVGMQEEPEMQMIHCK